MYTNRQQSARDKFDFASDKSMTASIVKFDSSVVTVEKIQKSDRNYGGKENNELLSMNNTFSPLSQSNQSEYASNLKNNGATK